MTLFSIGRVQTPTLAMLVERERAIVALRAARLLGGARHLRPSPAARRFFGALDACRRATRLGARQVGGGDRRTRLGARERCRQRRAARRAGARANGARAAADAVRSDLAAAHRQPALRAQCAAHARSGAGALREAQAAHLPAHRFAAPHRATWPRSCRSCSRRWRASPTMRRSSRSWSRSRRGRAAAWSTIRKCTTITPSCRRESWCAWRRSIATSGACSIWWRGGFSACFFPTPNSPSPRRRFASARAVVRCRRMRRPARTSRCWPSCRRHPIGSSRAGVCA